MDDVPGFVMWRGVGTKLKSHNEAPQIMLEYIRQTMPNYLNEAEPWQGRVSNMNRFKDARRPAK